MDFFRTVCDVYGEYLECRICPRECGVDRRYGVGVCGSGAHAVVNRVCRHFFEEPVICGERGAGAVFFSGCNLGCVYCQNSSISHRCVGKVIDADEMSELFLMLEDSGVSSIDLVTPTHFAPTVADALGRVKHRLTIPVVYNSGGYESVRTLRALNGLIDIYMPDLKYFSSAESATLSGVSDYFDRAMEGIVYMYDRLGRAIFDDDGMMRRGLIVRHLVLPGRRRDSIELLSALAEKVDPPGIVLSLMSQYTPDFYDGDDKNLRRRLTTFEYESVLRIANERGFDGFMQSPSSAGAEYTPPFEDEFVIDI